MLKQLNDSHRVRRLLQLGNSLTVPVGYRRVPDLRELYLQSHTANLLPQDSLFPQPLDLFPDSMNLSSLSFLPQPHRIPYLSLKLHFPLEEILRLFSAFSSPYMPKVPSAVLSDNRKSDDSPNELPPLLLPHYLSLKPFHPSVSPPQS